MSPLLQEAGDPPADVADRLGVGKKEHWDSHCWNSRWYEGRFKNLYDRWTRVVKLSDRVEVEWFKQVSPIGMPEPEEFPVSGIGTVAAARVTPPGCATVISVSMVLGVRSSLARDVATRCHSKTLAERLDGGCKGRVVHRGSCGTAGVHGRKLKNFLNRTGALAICGYTKEVDWLESAAFDALVLGRLRVSTGHILPAGQQHAENR